MSGISSPNSLIDKTIGSAFATVADVAGSLPQIRHVSANMEELFIKADEVEANLSTIQEAETSTLAARDAAIESETAAANSAGAALVSENNAAISEQAANTSAVTATTQADIATTKANDATASANAAQTSQDAAAASASSAATSATNALASKNAAATSEANAANSASDSLDSANVANTAATNAANSANAASTSATDAAASASIATTKATDAATSATNAANSANNAADSAAAAALSVANAAANVDVAVAALVDSAPTALNTLNELAAALGDDPNFATTVNNQISNKQPLNSDLTAIANLAGTSGFLKKTAANIWALDLATYLTGNQSITVTGDAAGSGSTAITLTLTNTGVTAGTYPKVTVDAKGRVTGGGLLVATDIPALDWSKITTGLPTTLAGYGITDAPTKTGTGASGTWGIAITGNAVTATTLQTARTINGTSFNGSANITTANWGTARTLTIGATGKSVNGSANVSWSLAEIGAAGMNGAGATGTWGISVSGNAATATKLATARTISLTGGVTGSVAFDGSGNVSITTVIADASHNHIIGNVDGLQTALDAKLDDSQATAAGLALLGAEDVAAQRSTLGLANHQLVSVDASGNLGLGMTPNGWALSGSKALQIKNAGLAGYANSVYLSANQYFNSGGGSNYIASDYATMYKSGNGQHQWFTAPSGTAGQPITFTQAMTLNESGRLLLNKTYDDGVNIAQFAGSIKATTYSTNGSGAVTLSTSDAGLLLANGAYKQFANMSGMILVNQYETGYMALYLCGSGGVALVSQHGTMPGTMAYDASVNGYRFTSNYASDSTYNFMVFKTRGAA